MVGRVKGADPGRFSYFLWTSNIDWMREEAKSITKLDDLTVALSDEYDAEAMDMVRESWYY